MKAFYLQRKSKRRSIDLEADIAFLASLAENVKYVGSAYHKSRHWFGGTPKTRRKKVGSSSLCPEHLHDDQAYIESWLKKAICVGAIQRIGEGKRFPKRVWFLHGQLLYEAMGHELNGEYHGYPLQKEEWPQGIEKIAWENEN